MAASSGNGGKRSNAKSPAGKVEKQSRKAQGEDSDKICGFHPLRSLRNIFFGYRTRGKPSLDDGDSETVPPVAAAKAKSTDDIAEQLQRQQQKDDGRPVAAAVVHHHAPVTGTNSANPIHRLSRTSIPMAKQLSKSADNLLSSTEWIPAPHGIPSAVISQSSGSEDSNLNASVGELNDAATLDSDSIDEFFADKWSQVRNSRTRAFSSGDAEGFDQTMTFDLDSVNQTKALDVSVAKDRIAIKPKNKRASVAMQQKMLKAETTPRQTRTYHLQSVTETDEEAEGEGNKETSTDPSAAAIAVAEAEDIPPPDRPIRREKKLLPVPDKNVRMTINITPDMLTGARKKATDRSSSILAPQSNAPTTNPRPNLGPPPPTCPKKRRTVCEPQGGGVCVQENKKQEEEPLAQNGGALGAVRRPPLLSLKEDEVVGSAAGEEEGESVRPKAPPRVRPKTRPKTMLQSTGTGEAAVTTSPHATDANPDWLTRVNKKN